MSFTPTALYPPLPSTVRGSATKLDARGTKLAYASGRAVIIRDLADPAATIVYAGHVQPASVARLAPSGFYCASADASGTVRIWDTVGAEHATKAEFKVLAGRINDLAWDAESKRIIAAGDGRDKFAHAFLADSGASTGDVTGHSKPLNAVAVRPQRPLRAVTAGDDAQLVFHHGVPFKYNKTIKTHSKFVHDVRYAPSGALFASVGADSRIFLYDGADAATTAELTDSPHTGSIMACAWAPDDAALVTAAADGSVKLWDVATRTALTTWSAGPGVPNQQVGAAWAGPADIVSLALDGTLRVFDRRVAGAPARVLAGPQRAVTALAPAPEAGTFLAGTADGRVVAYAAGEPRVVPGRGHTGLVTALAAGPDGVFSAGFDDRVREIAAGEFTPAEFATAAQPTALAAAADGTLFVAQATRVEAVRANQKVAELPAPFAPTSVAAAGTAVAVGGQDSKVRVYAWDGRAFAERATLASNRGPVSALAFSPDGKYLAAGDTTGRIALYDAATHAAITTRWSFHAARVNALAWAPDSVHCASGALDTHVYVWSVAQPARYVALRGANPGGVNAVLWSGADTLASAGADGAVRVWQIKFHA